MERVPKTNEEVIEEVEIYFQKIEVVILIHEKKRLCERNDC